MVLAGDNAATDGNALCQPSKQGLIKPRYSPNSMLSCGFHIGRSMVTALLDQMSCQGSLATEELCCIRLLLLACLDGPNLQAQHKPLFHDSCHGLSCGYCRMNALSAAAPCHSLQPLRKTAALHPRIFPPIATAGLGPSHMLPLELCLPQ